MDFEKLGLFYLGRPLDPESLERRAEPLLYDARDLVTHAAILGMTGSGKTGLGIALLEEAAIDGVPALVIDPKGDLADLALAFPGLSAEEFRPWVRPEDAERKGLTLDSLAAAEAEKWRRGLAEWGQDAARVARYREAARVALFTPGSEIATPISILASFAPPSAAVIADGDLFHDRIETAATSLLGLLGVDADPVRSREHVLLTTLLAQAWKKGQTYDLEGLIVDIQKPPIQKVGVFDIETFFPAADRFGLAMSINNLIAAPGFEVWMQGETLSMDRLLYDREGRPRLAVVSLAHLSDADRMFFLGLLLNEVVGWMRTQAGTSSLRAVLYMDEVFGYFPPVSNPPTKKPMLTLLKQARAYGLGLVLATQNPVDLDYKALSNMGTWFLGRLSTERDKERVLDGLEGVLQSKAHDRRGLDRLLSALRSRVFLMRNIHEVEPTLLETRWVLSYLAGPLDRESLRRLAAQQNPPASDSAPSTERQRFRRGGESLSVGFGARRPVLEPGVPEVFLVPEANPGEVVYRPQLLGWATVHFVDSGRSIEELRSKTLLANFPEIADPAWADAISPELDESAITRNPVPGIPFADLPTPAADKRKYPRWKRSLTDHLYRNERLEVLSCAALGEFGRPGEEDREFRIRIAGIAQARRDSEIAEVRQRFERDLQRLEDQRTKALARVEKEKAEASQHRWDSMLTVGSSVFGALLGRKTISQANVSRARSAARSISRVGKEAGDIRRAEEVLEAIAEEGSQLEQALKIALAEIAASWEIDALQIDRIQLKPRRADIEIRLVALAWVPEIRSS